MNLRKIGIILLLIGLVLLLVQYFGVIKKEIGYQAKQLIPQTKKEVSLSSPNASEITPEKEYIIPQDKKFGLVIPKIAVNVSVIPQVDPFDGQEYQGKLAQGAAHVKETAYPDIQGNTVIFAHSSDTFYNAKRYNALFYLLYKLEQGDKVYLTYQGKLYEYQVDEKGVVSKDELSYMQSSEEKKLTLLTCWPPGTRLKRFVVVATPKN